MTNGESRGFTLMQLQQEQVPWVEHNFPGRPSWMPLMGICEEVSELVCAHAKHDHEEILDAIGDIVVFASDYCSAMGWDIHLIHTMGEGSPLAARVRGADMEARTLLEMHTAVGEMQHGHLKMQQKIRGTRTEHAVAIQAGLCKLLALLVVYADYTQLELSLLEIVEATWSDVRTRDWQKARQEENWGSMQEEN
jgi:hypothetical protein